VRRIQLFTEHYATTAGHDTGISHALVKEVGAGRQFETLRLHHTGDIVAFGKHDTITPGYPGAVAATIAHGFTPIERLAGGRAAVFHSGTLAFAWAIPTDDPRTGVTSRFTEISTLLTTALRSLDVDAHVGEIPGEYCPGNYSIHADHRVKLVGVGQRLVRGAAHVGGVISVLDGRRIRDVLEPVYRELDLDWLPSTAGAIDDFVQDVTVDDVRTAVVDAFSERFELVATPMPEAIVKSGLDLAPSHISPG
jgi:lipoate-protein ligase A